MTPPDYRDSYAGDHAETAKGEKPPALPSMDER